MESARFKVALACNLPPLQPAMHVQDLEIAPAVFHFEQWDDHGYSPLPPIPVASPAYTIGTASICGATFTLHKPLQTREDGLNIIAPSVRWMVNTPRACSEATRSHQIAKPECTQRCSPVPVNSLIAMGTASIDILKPVKIMCAGAMSAVASRTIVAPLERVKMELMLKQGARSAVETARNVFKQEGVSGFWKGNVLNILRTAPFKALNFFSFDLYHKALIRLTGKEDNLERFAAGACAGVTATIVCFPLDVLRTRVMAGSTMDSAGSVVQMLVTIAKREGVSSLYAGCLPAVLGMAPAGAVFYGMYDLLKSRHIRRLTEEQLANCTDPDAQLPTPKLDTLNMLWYGAISGLCSEVVLYPLEVLRRKIQVQSMAKGMASAAVAASGSSMRAAPSAAAALGTARLALALAPLAAVQRVAKTFGSIAKQDGIQGFYKGMVPNILQVLPSSAVSYYTYETVRAALGAVD